VPVGLADTAPLGRGRPARGRAPRVPEDRGRSVEPPGRGARL